LSEPDINKGVAKASTQRSSLQSGVRHRKLQQLVLLLTIINPTKVLTTIINLLINCRILQLTC